MRARRKKWEDGQVYDWALLYLFENRALMDLEARTGVSHSTLWWCFLHRLPRIDKEVYNMVTNKLSTNKRHAKGN